MSGKKVLKKVTKKEAKKAKEISAEEAEAAILKERRDREKECADAVNKVLKQHNCNIEVALTISRHGAVPQMQIVSN